MGILKTRKHSLAIRRTKKAMHYSNQKCAEHIQKLMKKGTLFSCPSCKTNKHIIRNGSYRDRKKFICTAHPKPLTFNTHTSYEAMETYRETMIENLALFTIGPITTQNNAIYNETSKYFIEFALEGLNEYIVQNVQKNVPIKITDDIVGVFFDISGTGLAKNKAIILAKVQGRVIFQIVTTSNHLSTYGLLNEIKHTLSLTDSTQIVFITDGEACFVNPIQDFFPKAIHIRQFHKASCKGLIYIHCPHKDKRYTIRCLWDIVLDEGSPSLRTQAARKRRKLEQQNSNQEHKSRYSKLSQDIIIWAGTVYNPRGYRRLLKKKSRACSEGKTNKKKHITSPPDTAVVLFQGTLEKANEYEVMNFTFNILKRLFKGLHITSNIVENVFNVKRRLAPCRTIKNGDRLLNCALFANFVLQGKNKRELEIFFRENVITYDFVVGNVLYGSGNQKQKVVQPSVMERVQDALEHNIKLCLHYRDRLGNHSVRVVRPLKLNINTYDEVVCLEGFCYKRNDKRTFLIDRIIDISFVDAKPIAFCF